MTIPWVTVVLTWPAVDAFSPAAVIASTASAAFRPATSGTVTWSASSPPAMTAMATTAAIRRTRKPTATSHGHFARACPSGRGTTGSSRCRSEPATISRARRASAVRRRPLRASSIVCWRSGGTCPPASRALSVSATAATAGSAPPGPEPGGRWNRVTRMCLSEVTSADPTITSARSSSWWRTAMQASSSSMAWWLASGTGSGDRCRATSSREDPAMISVAT